MSKLTRTKAIVISIISVLTIVSGVFVWQIATEVKSNNIVEATPDQATVDQLETTVATPLQAETEPPTEKETEKPTEKPTEPPTETPTEIEVEISNPCSPVEPEEPNSTLEPNYNNSAFYLSDSERYVVECLVMGEAGGESYNLQVLTAQCILNACVQDNLQPSEVMSVYQYFGWNNNPTSSVKSAVSDVFDNGYRLTNEPILYFYAPHLCISEWHESQRYILTQDGIRFFARW